MLFNDSFRFRVSQVGLTLPIIVITLILISTTATISAAEENHPLDHSAEVQWIKMMSQPPHAAPNPRPDLHQATRDTDWQAMIDAVWGPGRTAAEQTSIFQNFIATMDYEYALFRNRDVDLVGLAEPYLSEIQAGVSKGRFQAIMSKMCVALQNGHTSFINLDVVQTIPEPGVPLLMGHQYMTNPYFGACLTTGDSGIFAYEVVPNHPLGLEVGDVILGYDGRPWSELYHELLDEELPIGGSGWLTSDASYEYGWDTAAGSNWHLFETIDIQKFDSGEIQHLPTSLMVDSGVDLSVFCSDQLNDDIVRPNYPEWATWGVLETGNSRIGFIWCDAWMNDVEAAFGQACQEMVDDPDLDGLIIDFRNNVGGNMALSNTGLSHLFNETVQTVNFGYRSNPYSHWHMTRYTYSPFYDIPGNPADYFDKPIAVLLGPKTISSGDQVALRMTYHPMVRTFGRQTSCSFDSPVEYPLNQYDEFYSRYSKYDAGRKETPQDYLSYLGFPVDQEVWLDAADCRGGIDSVIQAAIDWIGPDLSSTPNVVEESGSGFTGISPNPCNPRTVIKFQLDQAGPCRLEIFDVAGHLVETQEWTMLPTGAHNYVWNGKMASGMSAASGSYMVRLTAPDKVAGSRFTLVR
jgi:hypothetical protein